MILKRQTLIMNRAVAIVDVDSLPSDPAPLLNKIKKEVAMRCGFFPFFYGIGTQLILVVGGVKPGEVDTLRYVDQFDNQWSVVQSVFIVYRDSGLVAEGRTWGQVVTGKYQDIIRATLSPHRGLIFGARTSALAHVDPEQANALPSLPPPACRQIGETISFLP